MLGAIIGDIIGSRFERHNIKSKDFQLFTPDCRPTDDSIMTLAVAQALLSWRIPNKWPGDIFPISPAILREPFTLGGGPFLLEDLTKLAELTVSSMQELGRKYPYAGYGGHFGVWLGMENPRPYNSFGNGAAMRVSPCADVAHTVAHTLEEAKKVSETVTAVTHNHPEGIKGAEATTVAIFMAHERRSKDEIRRVISRDYYPLDFTLDEIRPKYQFDVTCQGTVPQAIMAFLEATDFEDAIRNAISIGGDSDTLAAITGSIAEAYYGIPQDIRSQAMQYLDETQKGILNGFEFDNALQNFFLTISARLGSL